MVDKVKQGIVFKASVMYVAVFLVMIYVIVKVVVLKCEDQGDLLKKSASVTFKTIPGHRGDIISSDGRVLASSVLSYDLTWDFMVPKLREGDFFERNVDTLAACISKLFGDSTSQYYANSFRNAFKEEKRSYPIKKRITYAQMIQVRKFPIFKLGRYKSGLIITENSTRSIPHKELAKRCIGFINAQGAQVGLEKAYNDRLAGVDGKMRMRKMGNGEWREIESEEGNTPPIDGSDVVTTLDVSIQDVAENSLMEYMVKSKAEEGTAVVMEVETGKIRAMANLQYDTVSHSYLENFNVAVGRRMPPGSTFKLATMIAVLEKTGMGIDDKVDLPGQYYALPGNPKGIQDEEPHILTGPTSIRTIFELSSNVGVARLVRNTYPTSADESEFTERLSKMHLDQITGVVIDGEASPAFRYAGSSGWWGGALEKMAIGYENEFTPLQILTLYNAVANGGRMVRPLLLECVKKHGVVIERGETEEREKAICDRETLRKVQELLVGVVQEGTASKAIKNDFFQIAGKTGTAQLVINNKVVGHSASFAGYFPADHPKYSCIVVIYKPKIYSYIYGSASAAPVFQKIAQELCIRDRDLHTKKNFDIASYNEKKQLPQTKAGDKAYLDRLYSDLNVQVANAKDMDQYHFVAPTNKADVVQLESVSLVKATVPNVIGMGLRDAMFLLKQHKMKVTVVGRGVVKKQSLPAYTNVKEGAKITIELAVN